MDVEPSCMELEKGKLYQVYAGGIWVVAEYSHLLPAHIANGYRGSDGARSWKEPARHYWNGVRGGLLYVLRDRGMQVRPVTEELVAEIEMRKAEIKMLDEKRHAAIRELSELCQ